MSAAAMSVVAFSLPAFAQDSAAASLPYHMADGTRTADYAAAVASWRADRAFSVDYSKGYMGLEHAYARGLTGAGATVGINDSGIYWNHPLFRGRNAGLDTGVSDALGSFGSISTTEPWHYHGTHVAGTAVGRRIAGQNMFGNAFGANVYSATISFAGNNIAYGLAWAYDQPTSSAITNLISMAGGGHARIINNSWGIPQSTLRFDATPAQVDRYFQNFTRTIRAQDWQGVIKNDALVVMSAGNSGQSHASNWNMTPRYVPEMRDHFLTVTNYRSTNLQNGSNLCGVAATWCLAGPGTNILSASPDYDFNNAAWRREFSAAGLYDDVEFRRLEDDGLYSEAIAYMVGGFIDAYIARRDQARANGVAFNEQTELSTLAASLGDFSRRYASTYSNAKLNVATAVADVYETIDRYLGETLTRDDVRYLTSVYVADMNASIARYITSVRPGYISISGTSMAAPNVSGFAALLVEAFPDYNTPLLTDILLSSGRDIEAPGVDIRAGWGVPQMEAALDGPSALRAVRDVRVSSGRTDTWTHDITDAVDRYSALVRERNPNDIGGLTKIGGGELILTGQSSYSGATRVQEGLLTVNGALTRSSLSVADVGIIGGTGQLASLRAEKGGVVAPGTTANPFGTLSVSGNATFLPGSFLWVRSSLNGADYSKLAVKGATTLEGGKVIVKADSGTWNLRSPEMTILTSVGGVTGAFEGTASDLAFLTPVLRYEEDAVLLQLKRNDVTIASAGTNRNERSAGAALDLMTARNSTGNLTLEDTILDGSYASVQSSIRYLTGEVHASLAGVTSANAGYVREAMLDRGRTMPTLAGTVQALDNQGTVAWASGLFGNGNFDGTKQFARYRNETNGFAAGIERHFGDGHLIGVSVGQTKADLKINRLISTGRSTAQQVGLYGSTEYRGLGLRAGGTWIDADFDTTRMVSLNRLSERLIGEYEGEGWQAYAEASYALQAGRTAVEPYANYTRYEFDATVMESGGDAALTGRVRDKAHLVTAGVRTNTLLGGGNGRPSVSAITNLSYTENLNEKGLNYRARFLDGPGFNIRGPQPGNSAINATLGVRVQANERVAFDVGYSGLHQNNYNDNRAYGRISLSF